MLAPILFILVGFVALVMGGEFLVRGASGLASLLKISPLVIGLTVVAFGTSAPELAVAIRATLEGQADISIGNIVGSNIFNVLGILGCAALAAPLLVSRQLVRFDVPLMIAVSFLTFYVSYNLNVSRIEGAGLFLLLLIYTGWLVYASRRAGLRSAREANDAARLAAEEATAAGEELPGLLPPDTPPSGLLLLKLIGWIVLGLVCLSLGSSWLVDGASTLARMFEVSELIIGLTIVAVGTSLPEAATSILASLRGERDIAVGNVVGSNLFNILCVLGLTAIVTPGGVVISETALWFDIPVMIAVAVVCLPIFFTQGVITRWEGGLLVGYYVLYTAYLILTSGGQPPEPWFITMLWVVGPLTLIILLGSFFSALRRQPS